MLIETNFLQREFSEFQNFGLDLKWFKDKCIW